MALRSRQSAFTLLELLVVLALMLTLVSSLYACFRIAFKSQDRAEAALAPARKALYALEFMRLDLDSAMVPNNVLAGPFEGTPAGQTPAVVNANRNLGIGSTVSTTASANGDTLTFYSCAQEPESPYIAMAQTSGQVPNTSSPTSVACDIRQVTYSLAPQPNDTTGTLFILQRSVITNLLAPEAPAPVVDNLCDGVLALNFQYFDGTNWWTNWDSTQQANTLPTAVQVTLQLQPPVVGQPDPNNPPVPYVVMRIFEPPCGPSPIGNPIEGLPAEAGTASP
jgi:prepilin-type N-terminal cleavage/methylation domain-containing protein